MNTRTIGLCLAFASLTLTNGALAHCEIPCGIYGDEARFAAIQENITTIEKSMVKIEELSGDLKNINQLTRWVNSKEHHADDIRQIVTQYFMTQRIKPPAAGDAKARAQYTSRLALLHKILVHAMKAKQTTDLAYTETLKSLIQDFEEAYFGKAKTAGDAGGSHSKHDGHDHGSHSKESGSHKK